MGYGDAGLARTKQWGRRNIRGKIVQNPDLTQFLNLNTIDFSIGKTTKKRSTLPLAMFKAIGFEPVGGNTEAMVLQFQLQYGVVKTKDSYGAGYYGPKTTAKLKEIYNATLAQKKSTETKNTLADTEMKTKHESYKTRQEKVFSFRTGSMGTKSDGVAKLQRFLVKQ